MSKTKVLFVCSHNAGRSQMAEALLNKHGQPRFEAESAGLEAGTLNPHVVLVLKEDEGIDISQNQTKDVFEFYKQGKHFDYVITVCDTANEQCPFFPSQKGKMHWSFRDPSKFTGSPEEILEEVKKLKEEMKKEITEFIDVIQID
ncbi:MAG TPA: arsenate reductase ArsC [Bacteroidia bacterium]|jgi:arsenate reductase|nr:arsenate reductase ArsC [Bacteroidia bacterium]